MGKYGLCTSLYRDALLFVLSVVPNNHICDGGIPSGQRRAVGTQRLNMEGFSKNHQRTNETLDRMVLCPVESHKGPTFPIIYGFYDVKSTPIYCKSFIQQRQEF